MTRTCRLIIALTLLSWALSWSTGCSMLRNKNNQNARKPLKNLSLNRACSQVIKFSKSIGQFLQFVALGSGSPHYEISSGYFILSDGVFGDGALAACRLHDHGEQEAHR